MSKNGLNVAQALLKARACAKKGQLAEARALYEAILDTFPKNVKAQKGLAALRKVSEQGGLSSANHPTQDQLTQDQLTQISALQQRGQLREFLVEAEKLVSEYPQSVVIWNILGIAHRSLGTHTEAIAAFQKAVSLEPGFADGHANLGTVLRAQGDLEAAVQAYKRALSLQPQNFEAWYNMGNALKAQGRIDQSISAFEKALEIKPDHMPARYNLGNALKDDGKLEDAVAAYQKVLELDPKRYQAFNNLGVALSGLGRRNDAIAAFKKALEIKPDHVGALPQLLFELRHICDWQELAHYKTILSGLGVTGAAVPPFSMLSVEDNPTKQLARSRLWAEQSFGSLRQPVPARPKIRPAKLRLGYFSADFHNFPGMYLMAGMLEAHDRSKFEVTAFSYGPDKSDEMRKRIVAGVDHFVDIRGATTSEVVKIAGSLDIAIHRNGYTTASRTELFQARLAPVQINYLGYPGSLGVDFIDYIVADPVVIPPQQRNHYSEKIIYLPHSYQPNDDTRLIPETQTSRADFGLPADGIVFCCFNNSYKISPREYDIWVRLLVQLNGSVLWLLSTNRWAEENLRREAEARGVDAERIVFAKRVPHAEHLARHKHADLFLDTFHYNAHTTASDALWAGLPVVTLQGEQFAARVAASLLHAMDLPELITSTEEEYEALILDLASRADRRSTLRNKIAANRMTSPLFDTRLYTRHFEAGVTAAYDQYFEGGSLKDIWV